jgi:uncharacterized protein (TIGR03437 family)
MAEPLEVAPAQLVMISTHGIARRVVPISVSIPETELDGLRASIRQPGFSPMTVQLLGIQQTGCGPNAPVTCDPFTGVTVMMPLAMPPIGTRAELVFNDRGMDIRAIPIRTVPDRIHVVSTCDEVAVFVGNDSPGNACGPVVRRATGGQLITRDNPARQGETVVVWAYGLGLPGRPVQDGSGSVTPALNAPFVYFLFGTQDTPAIAAGPGNAPAFAAAFPPTPLYQINITIPTLPQNQVQALRPCDGVTVTSNLTLMLSGLSSMDTVRLCVVP